MRKILSFVLPSLFLGVLLTGCGSSTKSLTGTTWSQDCALSANTKDEIKFTDTQMIYSKIFYDQDQSSGSRKTGCQTEDYRASYVFDYSIGDETGISAHGLSSVRKLDLKVSQINALPVTEAGRTRLDSMFRLIPNNGPNSPVITAPTITLTVGTESKLLDNATVTAENAHERSLLSSFAVTTTPLSGPLVDTANGKAKKLSTGMTIYQIFGIDDLKADSKVIYFGTGGMFQSSDALSETNRPASLANLGFKKR